MVGLVERHGLVDERVVLAVAARPLSRDPAPLLKLLQTALPQAELLVWTGTGEAPVDLTLVRGVQTAFKTLLASRVNFDVQTV